MKTRKLCLLLALAVSVPAHAAFRCVDEKGRTHVGDTPPPGCKSVVMYEVTRGGVVIRKIEPTMTEEQARAKAEAEEKAAIAAKAAAEQKRKDTALLSTYGNEKEFDVARDRNIEPLKQRITQSEERSKEIDKRVKAVKEEMEFYTAGRKKGSKAKDGKEEAASPLAAELERLGEEKKQIARNVEGYNKEIAEIRSKFDADKRRWVALKAGAGSRLPDEPKAEQVKADAPRK
jgi:chromosome segregation ATPase